MFLTNVLMWHSPKADLETGIRVQVIYLGTDFSKHGKKWGREGKKADKEFLITIVGNWGAIRLGLAKTGCGRFPGMAVGMASHLTWEIM